MAKKKAAVKKKVAKKKAVLTPVPEPKPVKLSVPISRGSFMQRSYGAQYRWEWDGKELRLSCPRKIPAVSLQMDFGPEAECLNFSGGKAYPDPDGVFRFNLLEPDMREGWMFVPEGVAEAPSVGLG